MNIDLQKIIGGTILAAGLIVFLFVVSAREFAYSIIVATFTLMSWIGYVITVENNRNYKLIGNIIFSAGIVMGIAIFFMYGVEEVTFPRGSFQFKASGIAKSLAVILFSMVPALLFYIVEDTLPKLAFKKEVPAPLLEESEEKDYDDDEWEEVSEENLESEDYEIA